MRVQATFVGRKAGAIGIFYPITSVVDIPAVTDLDAVRLALYAAGYEHIQHLRVTAVEEREGGSMRVIITINCDNAAFDDCPAEEVARILSEYARKVRDRDLPDSDRDRLMDVNGNAVGTVRVTR